MPAKRYGLPGRFDPEGIRVTHSCVARLNSLVVDALARAGADPMPVHPFSCTILKDGRIESIQLQTLAEIVRRGLLPVLHGDVAIDLARGAGIVSGDQLVSYLAKALKAEIVAIGTNVDGVIFRERPLERITRDDLPALGDALGEGSGVDVTGGMRGKLLELLDLADMGTDSLIFNASKEGNISKALLGEHVGTIVGRSA